jgi:branched-subunit amino acid transport protein
MNPWAVFLGMALVTYLTRFAMMPLLARELPRPLLQWLQLVPVAVLCALIAPAVLVVDRQLAIGPQIPAALVGVLVAWRTRSVPLTILAGMVCYWILSALM